MKKYHGSISNKEFLSDPKIAKHIALLRETGILDHIDFLDRELHNYKNLFSGALDILNRTSISDILDAAVWQLSERFTPSLIVFLWKPLQNREDIIIKSFRDYEPVDLDLHVSSISAFESFFMEKNEPVKYDLFSSEIRQNDTIRSFDTIMPELVIPILGPMGLYGLVLVGRKVPETEYTQDELTYIKNLMLFVSKAIQNNLHYERTLRDVKTGLYNNGFFMNRLSEEIARSRRTSTNASILIIDVDNFKTFNDTYGHLAGDKVLETLAITIKQGVRTEDVPSRFGGEEFTVLLPNTDGLQAWIVAERLRFMVEAMKVPWEPSLPQVTISLGISTFGKDTDFLAEEIINKADEALYLSKELGRNCTSAWELGIYERINKMKDRGGKT